MSIIDYIEQSINGCFACIPRPQPAGKAVQAARLIAHRGAHNNRLKQFENTDEVFAKAEALGCWGIEFDVQVTKDGVIVVNHDPCLTRLWGMDAQFINNITFKELRLKAPLVPTLEEIVQRYGKKMHLFIELKAPFNAEAALIQDLKTLTPSEDYHLISLDEETLAALKTFPRELLLLVATQTNMAKFCQLSLQKNYGGVLGPYLLFNNKKLNQLRAANQVVGVGFVDSKYSLYRELNRGIEWLFTNKAEAVSLHLKHLQENVAKF